MTEKEAIAIRDEDPKNSKLSFLVEMYRPTFWWWEVRASHKIPMRLERGQSVYLTIYLGLLGSGGRPTTCVHWSPVDFRGWELRTAVPWHVAMYHNEFSMYVYYSDIVAVLRSDVLDVLQT